MRGTWIAIVTENWRILDDRWVHVLGRTLGNEMKQNEEADLTYFVVLFWHCPQGTERNNGRQSE